ncbi:MULTISPECIES: fumarylacetoacetate hydrolase family protein [Acidobacterium]|uniref:Fumarylacetoacetate hydrolase family protein n=1 Tax=Acidobacterium capsulatum (strain ATCC 51196 / DSM 11244 / BCRC 80197 / JCM 7670 / NBRC 15755 / NCIMB 13165 / 161) TaxID=240015 RepID=C1F5U8_ACIC5|nr:MULTISPECIES: fumarylacetoacetate hydrolase family protein [Acidobacterium]ACO33455.1 fumarylacetoacetate hydrolase family protein [Acidobacterium capsulatum ATCC 51196]HCT61109.1 FAA hydrolase family protein [Acidobacterium sp.]
MRLVNFRGGAQAGFGVERDGFVYPLSAEGCATEAEFFTDVDRGLAAARAVLLNDGAQKLALADVELLAPVTRPGKILCIGLNYRDHAIESGMEIPKVPTVFLKLPHAVIGPGAEVVLPALSQQPDYEAELAAVIGKHARNVRAEDWEQYVLGYTVLNDVSARDVQLATSQWVLGKSFDTFCPLGPAIVTTDELRDPHALDIQLSIDGETLQHSNTRELIFKLPELIAYLSAIIPLEPGDIISTGTPAGVGLGRTPKRWLRPGEEMTVTIEGIGALKNRTVAARV